MAELSDQLHLTFDADFMEHHAGKIITDHRFAIVELVANAWDAGADRVDITWPDGGGAISVRDNGTGMTESEFRARWTRLNYSRVREQGANVLFPAGSRKSTRAAFGRNGVGRHAMFAFSKTYSVSTSKEGQLTTARVIRASGDRPYSVEIISRTDDSAHGTSIAATTVETLLPASTILQLIGSRFVSDPEFQVYVNHQPVTMIDLVDRLETFVVSIEGVGDFTVHRVDAEGGRTTHQSGVAWWVQRRLVGNPSWDGFEGRLIDGRIAHAKRYTYVVEADPLVTSVKPDWSGFYASDDLTTVYREVYERIAADLSSLQAGSRYVRKVEVVKANEELIKHLPSTSRHQLSAFLDQIMEKCPSIGTGDLQYMVHVLATLETSRSGYALLGRLATLDPDDVDSLTQILGEWTVADAQRVLDELHYRLELIKRLESLVDDHRTDELHDLQPIFERGLWIFGPEFESISFTSNRTLATVVQKFFGDAELDTPRRRPDFVVLPESTIGIYASDAFGDNHEVSGFDKIVIVELKRGGFEISHKEKDQALSYARQIRKSGKVTRTTPIICYVLGAAVDGDAADELLDGCTTVLPRTYGTVLRQAHSRTFNLMNKIEGFNVEEGSDDLDEILNGHLTLFTAAK